MGHGDEIAIVDANFPGASLAQRLIRVDGVEATRMLAAVLTLLPLDDFVAAPLATMAVVGAGPTPPIVTEFAALAAAAAGGPVRSEALEREQFYARARLAHAVVQTGEARLYGNVLVRKGVVRPG
jgi:L-fucose mutarotase